MAYTLTIEVYGKGSTDPPAGTYTKDEDEEVVIKGHPSFGGRLIKWRLIYNGKHTLTSSNPINFPMVGDLKVEAYFSTLPIIPLATIFGGLGVAAWELFGD